MKTIITEIPDYKTFMRGRKTVEIGYPWLTFGAIMALEKILQDSKGQFKVLEIGMGGSTVFFHNKCKKLISLENDYSWLKKVEEKIGLIEAYCMSIGELLEVIDNFSDESFDLILVDGGANYDQRRAMLYASVSKLKKGGWLVVDNYERMEFFDWRKYDVYTFDMLRYSGRGTKLCKKL